jgi:hypothetical protein
VETRPATGRDPGPSALPDPAHVRDLGLGQRRGEDIGWVAKMLGHANTEMVIRHYHKFIPNLTRRDSSALARRIEELGWH